MYSDFAQGLLGGTLMGFIPDLINFNSVTSYLVGVTQGICYVFSLFLGLNGSLSSVNSLIFCLFLIQILKYIDGLYPRPDLFQQ